MAREASARPLAIFRCDGDARIGTGHVMRCLTLADAFRKEGLSTAFVCRHLADGLGLRLREAGHAVVRLQEAGPPPADESGPYASWLGTTEAVDAASFMKALDTLPRSEIAAIVVDHYGLSKDWETVVGLRSAGPLVAMDDLRREHVCDILIDPTFGRSAKDYTDRVQAGANCLVGATYALLRREFADARPRALYRRDRSFEKGDAVRTVLVAMGGADADDATGFVLDSLDQSGEAGDFSIAVLVGSAYPHWQTLSERSAVLGGRIAIHRDLLDVAPLLIEADLCVGAAGGSSWERCCLGLPTINLVLADNQRTIAANLEEAGATSSGGFFHREGAGPLVTWSGERYDAAAWRRRVLDPVLRDANLRERQSLCGREIADGLGVERVVRAILEKSGA